MAFVYACSKGDSNTSTPTVPTNCASKNIVVTATTTNSSVCNATGSIVVNATGSSGFTYSINGGAFQNSNTFSNVAAGSYTVMAKDAEGCTASTSVTVASGNAGTLFSAVKTLIQTNCLGCHGSTTSSSGGMFLGTDCAIITHQARIKARVVDGTPSFMPQSGALPASERAKVTNWINAGGRFTD
ncbi:MAG: hypothetical protein ACOVNY_02215 [Chitinophagaceae bacterium]